MSMQLVVPCGHFTSKNTLQQIAAGIRKGYWTGLYVLKQGTGYVLGAYRHGRPFSFGRSFKLQRDAVSFAEDRYNITPVKVTGKIAAAAA